MRRRLQAVVLPLLLFAALHAAGQKSSPTMQGTWTASLGKSHVFRGSWTAAIDPASLNSATGYWTLRNDLHQVTLAGTWSARKIGPRWQGNWTARTESGQSFSGSWDAGVTDSGPKSFADMLTATIGKTVAGFWQCGRLSGNWWLDGEKPKSAAD